jgi:outer membrane lipopolysaccharide assembly protein LptE/RlpB
MKKIMLVLVAMVLILTSCGYYFKFGYTYLYSKYPECKDQPTQGDFAKCVQEIEAREGK